MYVQCRYLLNIGTMNDDNLNVYLCWYIPIRNSTFSKIHSHVLYIHMHLLFLGVLGLDIRYYAVHITHLLYSANYYVLAYVQLHV